jgi:hypothetical protein
MASYACGVGGNAMTSLGSRELHTIGILGCMMKYIIQNYLTCIDDMHRLKVCNLMSTTCNSGGVFNGNELIESSLVRDLLHQLT